MAIKSEKKVNNKIRQSAANGKKELYRKKLRYDRKRDPNCNCHQTEDGMYVYTRTIRCGDGWKKEVIASINPADYPNDTDISRIMAELDQLDYEEDSQEETLRTKRDKVFQWRLHDYEMHEDDALLLSPWETVAYFQDGQDLFDQLFPNEMPVDERIIKAKEFLATLQPQQVELIYQHLGEQRSFEDIRLEEQERTGRKISHQAFTNRWNRIMARAYRFFSVHTPYETASTENDSSVCVAGTQSISL